MDSFLQFKEIIDQKKTILKGASLLFGVDF